MGIMPKPPFILLVNPWITDFAAHDLWADPLGLLTLAALLRDGGCEVALADCLDRRDPFTLSHPDVSPPTFKQYGTGRFPRMRIPKPEAYAGMPRYYYRHGIHPEGLENILKGFEKPDLVWVTSVMTYWYPGVFETIKVVKEVFPESLVWLGGIYAKLCTRHAVERSGADEVVDIPTERIPDLIEARTGHKLSNAERWGRFDAFPSPALDLLPHPESAPLLTGTGCPYHCPFCAAGVLQPRWEKRPAEAIYREIAEAVERFGIRDFAFYDDALMIGSENSLKPALERVCLEKLGVRFHVPNAIHLRSLTPEWCGLLKESGFTTLRLGLETVRADRHREWGGKVEEGMFEPTVERLLRAGFTRENIGVYLLCGLPDQTPDEVADTIDTVHRTGASPYLCEYSPVPRTAMWEQARAVSAFDLEDEPLYHNNSFFACRRPDFTYEDLLELKKRVRRARVSQEEQTGYGGRHDEDSQ